MTSKSLIDLMRERIKSQGQSKGDILFIKAGEKKRIRFLKEMDEGERVVFHDKWGEVNTPCIRHYGKPCKYDKMDDVRTRDNFVWPVYDYEQKKVVLFMFKANDKTPIPALIGMYDAYGTVLDRDYVISRQGEKFETSYTVVPMDKESLKLKGIKVPTKKQMFDQIWSAFGSAEDLADEEEEEAEEEDTDDDLFEEDE